MYACRMDFFAEQHMYFAYIEDEVLCLWFEHVWLAQAF